MDAFTEFRIARDTAHGAGLPSFTYKGKRYARKKSGNITVYKRVKRASGKRSAKKKHTSARRR